ncbi:MAG: hypothetical protein M1382_02205 [Candidatus Marsarchaeota archaeon]|nr:hypothetical protein [Candidatus Marsarchaeota archaeon]
MGLQTKKPVKDIRTNRPIITVVEELLKKDKKNGYTVAGIMMDCYNVKESQINKSFNKWDKGLPTLYTRIRRTLKDLIKQGKVKASKDGKAVWYWWNAE